MKLLEVTLENVYGFIGAHNISIPFGLGVIAGVNGSGKTSLLEGLQFLFSGQNGEIPTTIPCQLKPGQKARIAADFVKPNLPNEPETYPKENHTFVDGRTLFGTKLRREVDFVPKGDGRFVVSNRLWIWKKNKWESGPNLGVNRPYYLVHANSKYQLGGRESRTGLSPLMQLVSKHAKLLNINPDSPAEGKWRQICESVEPELTRLLNIVLPEYEAVVMLATSDKSHIVTCLRDKLTRTYIDGVPTSAGTSRALEILFLSEGLGARAEEFGPDTIVAIDEFENGMHPLAVRLLLSKLQQQAEHRTILVSTHSPVVLRATSPLNLLVADLKPTSDGLSQDVRHFTAGARSTSTFDAQFGFISGPLDLGLVPTVLVEGYSEQVLVQLALRQSERLQDVRLFTGEGDSTWRYSRFLKDRGVLHACLFDNDLAGRKQCSLVKSTYGSQAPADVLPWKGTIEDLFPYEELLKTVASVTNANDPVELRAKSDEKGGQTRGFGAINDALSDLEIPLSKADLAILLLSTPIAPDPGRLKLLADKLSSLKSILIS